MPGCCLPLRTSLGSDVARTDNRRIAAILHEAELSPPQRIPVLAEPDICDFEASLPSNVDEAWSLLIQQRTSEPGYRRPDQQKRHLFRSTKTKEAKCNPLNWVFTKHEVSKAFSELLSRATLPVPGIAQALLSHASVASLEELWCHFYDPKLEKSTERRFKMLRSSALPKSISSVALKTSSTLVLKTRSPVARETTPVTTPEITWLDEVCSQDNLEFILLMCQAGLGEAALERAFKIALSKHSMHAMEILLSFGAVASPACQETIRERVKLHDVALVRLLLSAPSAMSVEAWQSCLEMEIESLEASWIRFPGILLLCLAHRPEISSRDLVLKALRLQDLTATAIILAYGNFSGDYFRDVRKLACKFASHVQDDRRRHKFFTVLVEAKFVADSPVLRQELLKDVKARQLPLIKLLAEAGVIVDMEPHNAFYWAVSHMDFDILKLFKSGKFSSPISFVLKVVPDSTSELDWLRLLEILGPIGLIGEPLDSCLICAVRRRQIKLIDAMIRYGASIEFEQASAVQTAMKNADLELLGILLWNKCSATVLSTIIPTAMALKPRPIRLQAMKALVNKGVLPQELGISLQKLVSEDDNVDSELVQLLLQHQAPVSRVNYDANSVVLVATRRGNISILKLLCDARPPNETLSKAVPVAFGVMDTCGYDVTLNMIELLLQKGATGLPIHQTLLVAAKQDQQEIARLLLGHGADANYARGASFGAAIMTSNLKLLQILCAKCPPSRVSIESVFSLAIDPRYYTSEALELLLSSTPDVGTVLNALGLSKVKCNPNIVAIVSCLLRHGLDVNLRNGAILTFAIQERNTVLLQKILSANPSITSLRAAFSIANHAQPKSLRLDAMRLLLEKANSVEIGQSEALLQQVHFALSGDFTGLQLLFHHKALGTPYILTKACLVTASSKIGWNEKQEIFESLLAPSARVSTQDMSRLLGHSVRVFPEYTQLPQLLLAHGAEVKFETIKVALETSSFQLLYMLLSSINSVDTRVATFRKTRKTTMVSDRRYWIFKHLLDKGIPSNDVSEALLDSLKAGDLGDLSFPKLFLESGASPCYQNGKPFSIALRTNSPKSFFAARLLTQYVVDDGMATVAFDAVRRVPFVRDNEWTKICRPLLEWNISKPSISQALVDSFKGGLPNISILQLLLAKGADPNEDNGYCFVAAAKRGVHIVFQALSKYAKLQVVLKALLDNIQKEWLIVRWFKVCLEEQPPSAKIDQEELMFQCISKFPTGTMLLKLLLDRGLSASAKIDYCLCVGWKPEPCTVLIWAIFRKPRVENDVILALLAQGSTSLPAYSTPLTKVSAAFGCLLDKTRLPILKDLLALDRERILDYMIPGSSFGPLAMAPKAFKKDSDFLGDTDNLPLREASVYLGNFEAFRLIVAEMMPNDEMLHLAALLALPRFVAWLLNTHDPNYKAEEFDNMIPLACVCASRHHHWCKIANKESDWKNRQKDTMRLLAGVTSSKWRYRNMTILHWAMENGLETAKAMIEALDIRHDPERDEKYLYVDRDGIEYSPQQYALKVWDADSKDKIDLISCLDAATLESRHFKRR